MLFSEGKFVIICYSMNRYRELEIIQINANHATCYIRKHKKIKSMANAEKLFFSFKRVWPAVIQEALRG